MSNTVIIPTPTKTGRYPAAGDLFVRVCKAGSGFGFVADVEYRNGARIASTDTYPFSGAAIEAGLTLAEEVQP